MVVVICSCPGSRNGATRQTNGPAELDCATEGASRLVGSIKELFVLIADNTGLPIAEGVASLLVVVVVLVAGKENIYFYRYRWSLAGKTKKGGL